MKPRHKFLTKRVRVLCRKLVGRSRNCKVPIDVIYDSTQPPELLGEGPHYETKEGQIVPHTHIKDPDIVYEKLNYYPSTHCITVGELWLREQINDTAA